MHVWQRILCAALSLAVIGSTGCGAGRATAGAVVDSKSKGHQSATVELKAQPDAVDQAAIAAPEKNPTLTIVKRKDADRELEISEDQKAATLKVTELSPGVSTLAVSSSKAEEGESATNFVLQAVKRVCEEMQVEYKGVTE